MSARPAILHEDAAGPILFYHSQSFYCQKVLFALHEKGVSFRQYEVNVVDGEQFSDWFLELNAKAELPLLKSGSLIIPGGAQIINYAEKNFVGGAIRELLPVSRDEKSVLHILQMSRIISRLPIGAISKGAFANATAMHLSPKMPFIQPVREALLNSNERLVASLRKQAEKSVKFQRILQDRAEEISKQSNSVPNREDFENILKKLEELLDIIEAHLKKDERKYFLSDTVTILDICFGILLHRLDMLGLNLRLWATSRPNIAGYFYQVQQLPSYQLSIPSQVSNARAMWGLMGILGKAM